MPTPDRNTQPLDGTGSAGDASAWLSVADAAALLGIGARAVQQRAERGTLAARRVAHGRAMRWEIDGQKLDENARANRSPDVRKTFAKHSQDVRAKRGDVRETFARRSPDVRATDGDLNARLLATLESEIKFLRGALEQRDRDAAELRAALRAALKLTAGTSAPVLTEGAASGVVVSSGSEKREQINTATAKQVSGRPLTIGDICDQLERDLEARNSK